MEESDSLYFTAERKQVGRPDDKNNYFQIGKGKKYKIFSKVSRISVEWILETHKKEFKII